MCVYICGGKVFIIKLGYDENGQGNSISRRLQAVCSGSRTTANLASFLPMKEGPVPLETCLRQARGGHAVMVQ